MSVIKNRIVHTADHDARLWLRTRNRMKDQHCSSIRRKLLKIRYYNLMWRNNAFIEPSTEFGKNVSFPHGLCGVFCSGGAVIGDDCTIMQQVTIGSNTMSDTKHPGAPVIGNHVFIGAGAKIIGGITVGSNVRIGANAVVYQDVPDNCTVVCGGGMRIIQHEGEKDNSFVSFHQFVENPK